MGAEHRAGNPEEPPSDEELERGIQGLFSEDYAVRGASIDFLARRGGTAAHALVHVLLKRRADPHVLANFADALGQIGKPGLPAILEGLEQLEEVRRLDDVYLLETFADLLVLFRDRRGIDPLRRQLLAVKRLLRATEDLRVRECCEAAQIRLHRVLLDLGDRGGPEDLLRLLGDGRKRVPSDLVDLLERMGTKDALIPLARLHVIEEPVSSAGAGRIKEAIRGIAQRERVRAEDPLLKSARPTERTTLERILPKSRSGVGDP